MSAMLQLEPRRVLLVEADRPLARVIPRALSPRYLVTPQPSAEGALHLLERGLDVHVVLSAYRLSHGTTARWLLSAVRRRWPRLRLPVSAPGGVGLPGA